MCVMNKQFELPEFVFDSVYDDLQYNEIGFRFYRSCGNRGSVGRVFFAVV